MAKSLFIFLAVLAVGIAALLADRFGIFGNTEFPVTPFRILAVALVSAGVALFFFKG